MKKLILLLFLPFLFISCSEKNPLDEIGKDPMQDGINLMTYSLQYISENNTAEANKLIRGYLDYYDKKELDTQILFLQGLSENYWSSQEANADFNNKLSKVREIIANNPNVLMEFMQLQSAELLQLFYSAIKRSAKVHRPEEIL